MNSLQVNQSVVIFKGEESSRYIFEQDVVIISAAPTYSKYLEERSNLSLVFGWFNKKPMKKTEDIKASNLKKVWRMSHTIVTQNGSI